MCCRRGQAYVETKTFEERWECVPVGRETPKRRSGPESGDSPDEDVTHTWKRITELVDTSVRGSSIFLLDPSSSQGRPERSPRDNKRRAHELMKRWMQGRIDACSILLGRGSTTQAQEACNTWRQQLRSHESARVSAPDAPRDEEVAGGVRLDASCVDYAELLLHNSIKVKSVATTKPHSTRFQSSSFPPPPITAYLRVEEKVVPLGKALLLLAYVTWEPSTRGRRLVVVYRNNTCMCVYGSEEQATAQLRSELLRAHSLSILFAATGLASLAAAAIHHSQRAAGGN